MIAGTSFAAGLNVYATVATLGLVDRAGLVHLPASLELLHSWWVIGVALAMFALEFFADKIPAFDLIWNALHTFVRVPIAALLAYGTASQQAPGVQLAAAGLGAAIALAAHSGKTGLRAAVTPSPEPLSNAALSFGEDAAAIGLTWFTTQHPYIAAGIVGALLIAIVFFMRWLIRSLRGLFRRAAAAISGSPT